MRFALLLLPLFLLSCGSSSLPSGSGNLGSHPTPQARRQQIDTEARGDFYYGRRYYVPKTRFWGYLRRPGSPWNVSKLVIFNESKKLNPDRLPEEGPAGARYGFDQNYEYRIRGRYTGRKLYEPNSNQFLPEFQLTGYELLDKDPGWLFSPTDQYNPKSITLRPGSPFGVTL